LTTRTFDAPPQHVPARVIRRHGSGSGCGRSTGTATAGAITTADSVAAGFAGAAGACGAGGDACSHAVSERIVASRKNLDISSRTQRDRKRSTI
jgi:hypothetical protein